MKTHILNVVFVCLCECGGRGAVIPRPTAGEDVVTPRSLFFNVPHFHLNDFDSECHLSGSFEVVKPMTCASKNQERNNVGFNLICCAWTAAFLLLGEQNKLS